MSLLLESSMVRIVLNEVSILQIIKSELFSSEQDCCIVTANMFLMCCSDRVKMPSQPRGLAAASGGLVVVACINHVSLRSFSLSLVHNGSLLTLAGGHILNG